MRPLRRALIDFTQRHEPALSEWEVLDETEETLMDWQVGLFPIANVAWSERAACRLLVTPEGEDVLVLELNDGHVYGLKCPPELLQNATRRGLRQHLGGLFSSPQAYIIVTDG